MLIEEQQRKHRERDFHNKAFADERRNPALKFYSVVVSSWRHYEDVLRAMCPNQQVREYGCGPGSYAFFMAEKCARVTGIDISETAIRLAGQRAEASPLRGPCFCVMDAERLGFVDETFDFVCGRAILHHLDIERSLSELERVPKHGGTAVFVEPLGHNPLINFYRKMTPSLRTVDEHPLISSDLVKIQSRFGEVRFRFFHFLSLTSVPFRGLPGYSYLLRLLDSLDQLLFRLLPFTRKYAWTIVIEMSRRAI